MCCVLSLHLQMTMHEMKRKRTTQGMKRAKRKRVRSARLFPFGSFPFSLHSSLFLVLFLHFTWLNSCLTSLPLQFNQIERRKAQGTKDSWTADSQRRWMVLCFSFFHSPFIHAYVHSSLHCNERGRKKGTTWTIHQSRYQGCPLHGLVFVHVEFNWNEKEYKWEANAWFLFFQ